ncbi:MAG: sulfatase [Thalassotalea sp.]
MKLKRFLLGFVILFSQSLWAATKPNVLFIAVDDLRPTIGAYGNQKIKTPNIDKLASEGFLFENAYASVPTCGASRSSLITSIRPTKDRFKKSYATVDVESPGAMTIPQHFRNNGYYAVSIGKIMHTIDDIVDHWDENPWMPKKVNYFNQNNIDIMKKHNISYAAPYEISEIDDSQHFDYQSATRAINKMEALSKNDQPFFLAVGFTRPHLPFSVPKKYWNMYPEQSITLPNNYFNPRYAPKQAIHKNGEMRMYHGVPKDGQVSDEMALNLIRGYHASISFADAQVGRVLDSLKQLGLEEDTIVVLFGDHGWQIGEHRLWNKHTTFKTGLHSPLIFKVPGKEPNVRTTAMTEFVDIFPTLCDLTGLEKPKQLQGESVINLFDDPFDHQNTTAFGRWQSGDAIFTERFAYTEYYDNETGKYITNMLFDHANDPDENVNVVSLPQYSGVVKKLSVQLKVKQKLAEKGW